MKAVLAAALVPLVHDLLMTPDTYSIPKRYSQVPMAQSRRADAR